MQRIVNQASCHVSIKHAGDSALGGINLETAPFTILFYFQCLDREICVFACRNAQVISIPVGTDSEIRMSLLEALGAVASPAGVQPAKEGFHEDEEEQG